MLLVELELDLAMLSARPSVRAPESVEALLSSLEAASVDQFEWLDRLVLASAASVLVVLALEESVLEESVSVAASELASGTVLASVEVSVEVMEPLSQEQELVLALSLSALVAVSTYTHH